MRLIDADVLILRLTNRHKKHYEDWNAFKNYSGDRRIISSTKMKECKEIIDIITESKQVDVRPVVHGEWIRVPSSDMATGQAYECSNCKKMRYGSFLPPFCQMCGADMKKKV